MKQTDLWFPVRECDGCRVVGKLDAESPTCATCSIGDIYARWTARTSHTHFPVIISKIMNRLDYRLMALPLINYIFMVYLFCQVIDLPIVLLQLNGQGALGGYGWVLPRSWRPHNIESTKKLLNILQLSLLGFTLSSGLLYWHANVRVAAVSSVISSISFYYCLYTLFALDERIELIDSEADDGCDAGLLGDMKSYILSAALLTLAVTLFGTRLIWGNKYDIFILKASILHAVINSGLILLEVNPYTADAIANEIDQQVEYSEKAGVFTEESRKSHSRKEYFILTAITVCAFLSFCGIYIYSQLVPVEHGVEPLFVYV